MEDGWQPTATIWGQRLLFGAVIDIFRLHSTTPGTAVAVWVLPSCKAGRLFPQRDFALGFTPVTGSWPQSSASPRWYLQWVKDAKDG